MKLQIFYSQKNAYHTPDLITHHFLLHSTVSLSAYFDKSHLELWGTKQVLIQRASNLSHRLKSWKNIWPQGLFNTIFSIYPHLPGLFFPLAKSEWWQLSKRWDLWQKISLSLFLSLRLTSSLSSSLLSTPLDSHTRTNNEQCNKRSAASPQISPAFKASRIKIDR